VLLCAINSNTFTAFRTSVGRMSLNQWFPKWAVPPLGGSEKF